MIAVASVTVGLINFDCLKWHRGPISIHMGSRHREQADMIDPPNNSALQLDNLRNDEFPSGNDSSRPQITATTIPEEADHDHAPPIHDFDDWSMDIDGEGDGGFFGDERTQIASEDEGASNERDQEDVEDVEDLLQILMIDNDEESTFEDEEEKENVDEELEDLDDHMHDRTDDDEADSIRLLLIQLKELSDISDQGFKANTSQRWRDHLSMEKV